MAGIVNRTMMHLSTEFVITLKYRAKNIIYLHKFCIDWQSMWAEWAENGASRSRAVSGHSRKHKWEWSMEQEAAEQRAGVTKIGFSAEWQIGHSHSAHMICWLVDSTSWKFGSNDVIL